MPVEMLIPLLKPIKPPSAPAAVTSGTGMRILHPSPTKGPSTLPRHRPETSDASYHGSLSAIELLSNDFLGWPPANPEADNRINARFKKLQGIPLVIAQVLICAVSQKGMPNRFLACLPAWPYTARVGNYVTKDWKIPTGPVPFSKR